jgi:hypothetical protein
MNAIVDFGGGELPRIESEWAELVVWIALGKNGANGVIRRVGFKDERLRIVRIEEEDIGSKTILQGAEGQLLWGAPDERGVFAKEEVEGVGDLRKIWYETTVIIDKAEKF